MVSNENNSQPIEDESKHKSVAIKKVKNVFENEIYAHRILREIRLLRILRGHKNVSNKSFFLIQILIFYWLLDCQVEDYYETKWSKDI